MADKVEVLREGSTDEAKETMSVIRNTLNEIIRAGHADCRICGKVFYGTLGEVLEQLGEHGNKEHNSEREEGGE